MKIIVFLLLIGWTVSNCLVMSYNRKNRELIEENRNLLHQVDFLQRCFNVQKEKRMNKQAQDESDLKSYELYMYYYDDKTGKFSSLPPFVMEVKGKDIRDAAAKFAVHSGVAMQKEIKPSTFTLKELNRLLSKVRKHSRSITSTTELLFKNPLLKSDIEYLLDMDDEAVGVWKKNCDEKTFTGTRRIRITYKKVSYAIVEISQHNRGHFYEYCAGPDGLDERGRALWGTRAYVSDDNLHLTRKQNEFPLDLRKIIIEGWWFRLARANQLALEVITAFCNYVIRKGGSI